MGSRPLIPASGFFEWTKAEDGGKDPHYIYLSDHESFAFAGLWTPNNGLEFTSCTILTAPAAAEIEHLHHLVPIILNSAHYDQWLDVDSKLDKARELLKHNRGSQLVSHRIGRALNSSRASGAELIEVLS